MRLLLPTNDTIDFKISHVANPLISTLNVHGITKALHNPIVNDLFMPVIEPYTKAKLIRSPTLCGLETPREAVGPPAALDQSLSVDDAPLRGRPPQPVRAPRGPGQL